ncbi:MAG: hypothetical protein P8I43_01580 [Bacteroidia bacterium]|nr:hypothetical protein [Bacteroidia bacterium]
MKPRYIFISIGIIHVLIGLSLIGMIPNFDEAIKTWISSDIPEDIKGLILGQTRVIITHSIGTGIILIYCRNLKNNKDIKKVLLGYLFLIAMILTNITYGIVIGSGGPPMPVILLYAIGGLVGSYGFLRTSYIGQ